MEMNEEALANGQQEFGLRIGGLGKSEFSAAEAHPQNWVLVLDLGGNWGRGRRFAEMMREPLRSQASRRMQSDRCYPMLDPQP